MSHRATSWAVQQRGLKPAVKVLLWHLADRHNVDNGCFPNQSMLAEDCEMSRATVNRHLDDLERAGLIRRVQRVDPDTKRQLSTRYILAFEDGFKPLDVDSRVSNLDTEPCLKNGDSRVSNVADSVSHSCETLTSKGTRKEPGSRPARVPFDDAWEAMPRSPYSREIEAKLVWDGLSDDDTHSAFAGIVHYSAWFREECERRKQPIDDRLTFAPALARWLRERGWVRALTLKVKSRPLNAEALSHVEYVDRIAQPGLFQACERVRGKPVPDLMQRFAFDKAIVEQARQSEQAA